MRCITSGRFTPAAATFTSTSRGPGAGTGRSCGTSTSGPPGERIAMAVIWAGIVLMVIHLYTLGGRDAFLVGDAPGDNM